LTTPPQLAIVTFRYLPSGGSPAEVDAVNEALVDRMLADRLATVTATRLRGRTVLRLCTINPRTTEADLEATLRRLAELAAADPASQAGR